MTPTLAWVAACSPAIRSRTIRRTETTLAGASPLGHGLLTVPRGPTEGLLCKKRRPSVAAGGTVRRPCPNVAPTLETVPQRRGQFSLARRAGEAPLTFRQEGAARW